MNRTARTGAAALAALVLAGLPSSAPALAQAACKGRVVRHAMGETCVPLRPQRVVVLDTGELDTALALGVKPVGAVQALADKPFQDYLAKQAEGIASVGTIAQPSLERILALKPDLILSSKLRHAALYPQLSRIAPTVFSETVGVTWQENIRLFAKALNREAQAALALGRYESRVTNLRSRLGGRTKLPVVSVVRFVPGQIRLYARDNFIGTILEDIGLPRPALQDKKVFAEYVSQERVPDMDGDLIFYGAYGDPAKTDLAAVTGGPLWPRLSAVKAGRAHRVDDDHWFLGIGVLAAYRVLDDLEKHLLAGR